MIEDSFEDSTIDKNTFPLNPEQEEDPTHWPMLSVLVQYILPARSGRQFQQVFQTKRTMFSQLFSRINKESFKGLSTKKNKRQVAAAKEPD
jgi:hypothetical protein